MQSKAIRADMCCHLCRLNLVELGSGASVGVCANEKCKCHKSERLTREDRFVVGARVAGNAMYGHVRNPGVRQIGIHAVAAKEAQASLKMLSKINVPSCLMIYELVPRPDLVPKKGHPRCERKKRK